ncbi:MAG: hypothetical protein ACRBCK_02700 [Alphaproteobacteria bacterium]
MGKRLYPHNRVRYWYAYDLDGICALFSDIGLHIQTIRVWVRNGLKTIDSGKPTLVYGNDLIAYLKAQNDKGKCQTPFDQIYCMKCKDARPIYKNKITTEFKNGFVRTCGHCRECKTKMFKNYKMDDYGELKRIFYVVDVSQLYDSSVSSVKTHIHAHEQTLKSESYTGDLFE